MGYCGVSMSERASEAYSEGKKPKSKWKKRDIISLIDRSKNELKCDYNSIIKLPLDALKRLLLTYDSYHHTSPKYNITDFYAFDTQKLLALTDEDLQIAKKNYDNRKKKEIAKKKESQTNTSGTNGRWKAIYTVTSVYHKGWKKEIELTGEVRDGWLYPDNENEKKRKIGGKNLRLIERIE